ncbi:MAG TPA: O-antigen ligase family protein [Xanthomonadales bacterium]|nr:O-antigen ligase family protein [Xanthomonadales bacterium]
MKKLLASGKWNLENTLYYLLVLFLPTQLGKHFWPDFSYVLGIRVDYLSPTLYLTDLVVGLLFIAWLLRKLKEKQNQKSKIKEQRSKIGHQKHFSYLIYIFTFLYLIFNILISDRILGGLYSSLKLLEMAFVAYYSAKFVVDKNVFGKVALLLGVGAIFESLLAIAQFLNKGSIGGLMYFFGERAFDSGTPGIANASLNGELILRPYGTLPHPNVLAGYLLVVMILVLFTLHHQMPRKEARSKSQESWFARNVFSFLSLNSYFLIQIPALVLGTVALFLSMSRIAILLWVTILLFVIPAKAGLHGSRIKSGMTARISAFLCITMLAVFLLSPIGSRFIGIKPSDEAVVQREILNEKAIEMIGQNPLLGVGLGNFLPSLSEIQKPLSTSTYLQPVHNIFLLVAAEAGLIGLGFFLWFLWKTYKMANGKWQMANGLLICFSTILILGLFDHYWLTLQQGQLLFAFIIGLCWAKLKNR